MLALDDTVDGDGLSRIGPPPAGRARRALIIISRMFSRAKGSPASRNPGHRRNRCASHRNALPGRVVLRPIGWVVGLATLMAAATGLWALRWLDQPLPLRSDAVELTVERGRAPLAVASDWVEAGVDAPVWALQWWFRLSGDARRIRAGSYAAPAGTTPRSLLERMVRGDEALERLTVVEGWTLRQLRAALAAAPGLRPTLQSVPDAELLVALGLPAGPAEGRFFPDTYRYGKGVSDRTLLLQAHRAMQDQLAQAWSQRQGGSPLRSPDELLILASIVEKETGRAEDRARVAEVFINRLRLGMPLQTDPTVIYGLGAAFDGNLRKRDLLTDTPFNTYTRRGLPPHPIAMPGQAALQAVVRPSTGSALYFVARGDGSSQFSDTLEQHNQAVWRYQKSPADRRSGAGGKE